MSVALFSARQLGAFAATVAHLEISPLSQAVELAGCVALGNAAAWNAQYCESESPVSQDEIAAVAKQLVGDEDALEAASWGPLAYNMVTNDGTAFAAPGVVIEEDDALLAAIRKVEDACREWQERRRRDLHRAEQNAAAYNVVGQLKTKPINEIAEECKSLGYSRIIVAEFSVDESDSQSDYYGGRHTRKVVIGYGKGNRESFKQLRQAAANFPATAHLGPGKDEVTVYAYGADEATRNSKFVPTQPLRDDHYNTVVFSSEAEARQHVDALIAQFKADQAAGKIEYPRSTEFVDYAADYGYDVRVESYEHRETYSMGGGNYLGERRYGGWKVSSYSEGYGFNSTDPVEITDFDRAPVQASKPAKKTEAKAEVVEYEVTDGDGHCLTVKAGKRKTLVFYSKGERGDTISVVTGSSRLGKWFNSWDRAKANYRAANIKAAIQVAEDAVSRRLASSGDSVVIDEPEAVSVDPAAFDEFAWL